jgi:hypothetical protein
MIEVTLRFAPGFAGNRLLPGDIVDLPDGRTVVLSRYERPVQRGKDKGCSVWSLRGPKGGKSGEEIVVKPEVPLTVRRSVPDAQEREAYRAARRDFHMLVEVVDAFVAVHGARQTLASYVENDSLFRGALVHSPLGGSVLRDAGATLEASVGYARGLFAARHRSLREQGHDLDSIMEMAAISSLDDGGVYSHSPEKPVNANCYADGTPAPHEALQWDVAPMTPEEGTR